MALLDIAASAAAAGSLESEWWDFVAQVVLGLLFHADVMAVNVLNVADQCGWFAVVHPEPARTVLPVDSLMDDLLLEDHPFTERLYRGPVTEPIKVTDLISQRQWRNRASYQRMRELTGGAHHLTLHFRSRPPHQESLSIVRADRDFDAEEMALAAQLQVVLQLGLTQLRHTARLAGATTETDEQTAANAARALGISARERLVLRLVDQGVSTHSIGRQLGIATRTVYKHQENLYRKLGVRDRVGALDRARRQLLLPPAPLT